jgi:hypothetical protein
VRGAGVHAVPPMNDLYRTTHPRHNTPPLAPANGPFFPQLISGAPLFSARQFSSRGQEDQLPSKECLA